MEIPTLYAKKIHVKLFFLIVALYFYIYAPPLRLMPFNISLLPSMAAMVYFGLNSYRIKLFLQFRIELLILFIIFIYGVVLFPIASDAELLTPFIIIFFKFPFCLFFAIKIGNASKNADGRYDILLWCLAIISIIASLISILLWNDAELSNSIKFHVLKYDEELMKYQSHRAFGFADELLFSFSLVQATIFAAIIFRYGWSKYTSLIFILIFVSVLLNARIGFVFLFLSIIMKIRKKNLIPGFFAAILFYHVIVSVLLTNDFNQGESILFQIVQFIRDFDLFNNQESVFLTLFGDMLFFPDTLSGLFFGEGAKVFGSIAGSDSGYINSIFFGGLFYLFLIFLFFIKSCVRLGNIGFKSLSTFLFLLFFISNFKGQFFIPKPAMNLFILLYVCIVYFYSTNDNSMAKQKHTHDALQTN